MAHWKRLEVRDRGAGLCVTVLVGERSATANDGGDFVGGPVEHRSTARSVVPGADMHADIIGDRIRVDLWIAAVGPSALPLGFTAIPVAPAITVSISVIILALSSL